MQHTACVILVAVAVDSPSSFSVTGCVCKAKVSFKGGMSSMKEHLKCKHLEEDPFKESDKHN